MRSKPPIDISPLLKAQATQAFEFCYDLVFSRELEHFIQKLRKVL